MKHLVVQCHGGLGNRIRALIAGERVARILNRQLCVQWPIDGYHCGCPFNALFDTKHLLVGTINPGAVECFRIKQEPNLIENSLLDYIHIVEENFFWAESDRERGYFWGQFGPSQVRDTMLRDELLQGFNRLKPSSWVGAEVSRFHQSFMEGSNVVGVHVRREDNHWSKAFCSDALFVRPIQRFLSSHANPKILLCTDGDESRDFFHRRFPGFIIEYSVRSFDRGGNWMAVQDALICMLLMARCGSIIRSVSSTFSQCASWFGNLSTMNVGRPQHFT